MILHVAGRVKNLQGNALKSIGNQSNGLLQWFVNNGLLAWESN